MSEEQTVLVADDDDDILQLVKYRLERSGFRVLLAHNGEEAVQLAFEHRPDLAVLDVMMPKADGYEVTRKLRDNESTADMPVILLTARVQETDVTRGFEAGANDYVRKPFGPQELHARIDAALAHR